MTVMELRSMLADANDDANVLVYIGSRLKEIQPRLDSNTEGQDGYIFDDLLDVIALEKVRSDGDEVYLYLEDFS